VDWTATISAPGNDDPTNDVLTETTSVICRDYDDHDDNDSHDDNDHRYKNRKRGKD
jgi:hypothetical protein